MLRTQRHIKRLMRERDGVTIQRLERCPSLDERMMQIKQRT
jgi:hypothetical protein